MAYEVWRKGWSEYRVGAHETKEDAEADALEWNEATTAAFKRGRIMYDVPEYEVRPVER